MLSFSVWWGSIMPTKATIMFARQSTTDMYQNPTTCCLNIAVLMTTEASYILNFVYVLLVFCFVIVNSLLPSEALWHDWSWPSLYSLLQWIWRGGVYWFHLVHLSVSQSVSPSLAESCPLCIFHNTSHSYFIFTWLFIFTHLINRFQRTCLYFFFFRKLQNLNFCHIFLPHDLIHHVLASLDVRPYLN